MKLLDDVRKFGRVVFVFSGGDAFKRPDIIDLVRHGVEIGLRMVITPATTSLVPVILNRQTSEYWGELGRHISDKQADYFAAGRFVRLSEA